MDGSEPIKAAGIEVPAEERTPLVDILLRVIEELRAENGQLRDEIARLKGLPPRPTIRPSTLNATTSRSLAQETATGQTAGFGQTAEDGGVDDPRNDPLAPERATRKHTAERL